jgi:prophage regulatory protein
MKTRLIRLPAVLDRTGDSRSSFLEKVKRGLAPKPVRIGLRSVAYVEAEVDAYIERLVIAGKAAR